MTKVDQTKKRPRGIWAFFLCFTFSACSFLPPKKMAIIGQKTNPGFEQLLAIDTVPEMEHFSREVIEKKLKSKNIAPYAPVYVKWLPKSKIKLLGSNSFFLKTYLGVEDQNYLNIFKEKFLYICKGHQIDRKLIQDEVYELLRKVKMNFIKIKCGEDLKKPIVFMDIEWFLMELDPHGHAFYQYPYLHYVLIDANEDLLNSQP
jgi:hypothetical protein